MNNSRNENGNGGQLVSQLMQEINSGTGNETPYTDQEYYPQAQSQAQAQSQPQPQHQPQQEQQNFDPKNIVPPPKEDDVEGYEYDQDEEDEDDSDDEYYYKENNLNETLSQVGGEYTSFIMDLLKNCVIIFIGYIIFSHPLTQNYIMEFASSVPGLRNILNIPTYNLAVNGILFVIFYFAISYFI